MYSFKTIALILGIAIFSAIACGNKEKTPNTSTTPTAGSEESFLTMKINGQEWSAEEDIIGNLGLMGPGQFTLGGSRVVNGEEQHLSIAVHNVTGPGTYKTDAGQIYNVVQYALSQQSNGDVKIYKSQKDGAFTINITQVDDYNTEGTFSGTLPGWLGATGPITITDGKFRTRE